MPKESEASFAGDATNVPASTSVPVILYEPESFVIWGGNATAPHLGDRVNFWGSQWAKQVTGGDFDNTADFKGWAIPAGSPIALCEPAQHADDKCWTSKPGQPFPPSTIERYISVMVSTSIGQELGEIYGNIAAVVIVRVDPVPQYRNDPGKPGFGTIVAVIADGAHLFSASKLHIATTSIASGTKRYSLYTPEMSLMAETALTTTGAPPIAFEYIWFNGHPVAQFDVATNTTHWTFTDHLGTPIIETNGDGTTYWRAEYEPYGAVFSLRSPDVHQPLRLPGQEAEQLDTGANGATERDYNIFRWYRGGWGRYTQADPVGLAAAGSYDGLNELLGYSDDRPLLQSDHLGLLATSLCTQKQIKALREAESKVADAIHTCKTCSGDPGKWIKKLKNLKVHCVETEEQGYLGIPSGTCGQASTPEGKETGSDILVTDSGFNDLDSTFGCGCLEGTLLHEIVHIVKCGHNEDCTRRATKACFPCALGPRE